jgi:hypothetical protein
MAQRYLEGCDWDYRELIEEKYAKCLDEWDNLTEFGRGRYIGLLEEMVCNIPPK